MVVKLGVFALDGPLPSCGSGAFSAASFGIELVVLPLMGRPGWNAAPPRPEILPFLVGERDLGLWFSLYCGEVTEERGSAFLIGISPDVGVCEALGESSPRKTSLLAGDN